MNKIPLQERIDHRDRYGHNHRHRRSDRPWGNRINRPGGGLCQGLLQRTGHRIGALEDLHQFILQSAEFRVGGVIQKVSNHEFQLATATNSAIVANTGLQRGEEQFWQNRKFSSTIHPGRFNQAFR